jgi:hypothetical protein
MVEVEQLRPIRFSIEDAVGWIPQFLSEDDPRPAKEQLDTNYKHGGGWNPMNGWHFFKDTLKLYYPGDPAMLPFAKMKLRDEVILVYDHSWVLIMQPDGSHEVSRMD